MVGLRGLGLRSAGRSASAPGSVSMPVPYPSRLASEGAELGRLALEFFQTVTVRGWVLHCQEPAFVIEFASMLAPFPFREALAEVESVAG